MAVLGGEVDGSSSLALPVIIGGPGSHQHLHYLQAALLTGAVQGCEASLVLGPDLRPVADAQSGHLGLATDGCIV